MNALVALATAAGVILTAVVTLLIAVRRFSGTIRSSEASSLWEESRDIRKSLLESNREQADRIAQLEGERSASLHQVAALQEELSRARERIARLETKLAQLTGDDEPPNYLT
jgi:ubiquinone biosynthesis protein UbiJ